MKAIFTFCLAVCASLLSGQGVITEAEYFIDNDPGFGDATAVSFAAGASVIGSASVSTSSLNAGLHVIALRTKNDEGRWSIPARKNFFVYAFSAPAPIAAAEYFFDEDPGPGNGDALAITPGPGVSGSAAIPLPDFAPGLHTLSIRTMNAEGFWSLYVRKNFYVFLSAPDISITAAEYFFNEDPGAGNGTALPVTQGASTSLEVAIELPADLPKGLNTLQMRVRDSDGRWSPYARRMFFNTKLGEVLDIVYAEYFIDEDPGEGEALPLGIAPAPNLDQLVDIPLPENLSEGDHMLYIRVLREDEKWSLLAAQPFVIDFSAGTREGALSLSLYPNPTADLLHIDVAGRTLISVAVFDMQGKTVLAEPLTVGSVSLSRLGRGTYLVQLRFDDGHAVSKRIVVM